MRKEKTTYKLVVSPEDNKTYKLVVSPEDNKTYDLIIRPQHNTVTINFIGDQIVYGKQIESILKKLVDLFFSKFNQFNQKDGFVLKLVGLRFVNVSDEHLQIDGMPPVSHLVFCTSDTKDPDLVNGSYVNNVSFGRITCAGFGEVKDVCATNLACSVPPLSIPRLYFKNCGLVARISSLFKIKTEFSDIRSVGDLLDLNGFVVLGGSTKSPKLAGSKLKVFRDRGGLLLPVSLCSRVGRTEINGAQGRTVNTAGSRLS